MLLVGAMCEWRGPDVGRAFKLSSADLFQLSRRERPSIEGLGEVGATDESGEMLRSDDETAEC
jgi:hypothetical protein